MRSRLVILLFLALMTACDPSPSLTDADGRPFELWKNSAGSQATVLIFTRTDCPISNRYAPTVRALCDTYSGRGVDFLLVYVDPKENPKTIRRHLEEYQYSCQAVHDPLHELVRISGATVTPEAVVFDSQRKTVYQGRIDDLYEAFGQSRPEPTSHDLADALDALLAGGAPPNAKTKAVGCYIGDLK